MLIFFSIETNGFTGPSNPNRTHYGRTIRQIRRYQATPGVAPRSQGKNPTGKVWSRRSSPPEENAAPPGKSRPPSNPKAY